MAVKKPYKFNDQRKEAYCDRLRQGLRRGAAAKAVGVTYPTVWEALRSDAKFANAVAIAESEANEIIEDSLFEQAKRGNVVAIQVWLYNRCPERWRDKRNIVHEFPTDAQRNEAFAVLDRLAGTNGAGHPRVCQPSGGNGAPGPNGDAGEVLPD